jgi:hypothetical protein
MVHELGGRGAALLAGSYALAMTRSTVVTDALVAFALFACEPTTGSGGADAAKTVDEAAVQIEASGGDAAPAVDACDPDASASCAATCGVVHSCCLTSVDCPPGTTTVPDCADHCAATCEGLGNSCVASCLSLCDDNCDSEQATCLAACAAGC